MASADEKRQLEVLRLAKLMLDETLKLEGNHGSALSEQLQQVEERVRQLELLDAEQAGAAKAGARSFSTGLTVAALVVAAAAAVLAYLEMRG